MTATVGMPDTSRYYQGTHQARRDPREDGARLMYSDDVTEIEDLTEGMISQEQ